MARDVQLDGYEPVDRSFAAGLADESTDADLWVEVDDRRFSFVKELDRSSSCTWLTALRLLDSDGGTAAHSPLEDDAEGDRIPGVVAAAVEGATFRYVDPDAATAGPDSRRHVTDVIEKNGRLVALLLPGDGVLVPLRKLLDDAAYDRIEFLTLRDRVAPHQRC